MYTELKELWAAEVYKLANGLVKNRTVRCNYAPVYATMEYIFTTFSDVYNSLGFTWEDFMTWTRTVHVEEMQILHVETDHAASYIRR